MLTFFTIVHVLLCVFMIFVILLQPGKDAGMGSALGGGAATSAFGGRGAVTFLSKLTGICAGLFFLTSLGLSFVGLRTSVAAGGAAAKKPPAATAPATPGGAAAPAESSAPTSTPAEAPQGQQEAPKQ
ncbi:preprotein translocase subunit SecG [Myxococcaceae bacterium JPH2]|nr:preprotein translocase subunit SecG [Myxococcaceae bacterium JPH2]